MEKGKIQINMPLEIKEKLKKMAEREGFSLNAFILMIIYDYLGKTK